MPPDELEWWMGTYTYFPTGQVIHCDPIGYGCEDEDRKDISESTTQFMIDNAEKILGIPTKSDINNIVQ